MYIVWGTRNAIKNYSYVLPCFFTCIILDSSIFYHKNYCDLNNTIFKGLTLVLLNRTLLWLLENYYFFKVCILNRMSKLCSLTYEYGMFFIGYFTA